MTEFGRAYGSALYALAQEDRIEENVLHQLQSVCDLLTENPQYIRLIACQAIAKKERLDLIDRAFSGNVETDLLHFMKLLCERGAFAKLDECQEAYVQAYNEQHGIVPALVVSACALSEQQQEKLKSVLSKRTGKTIQLEVRVDPAVKGGMMVEMAGHRYDNTIAGRMEQLRHALAANT